MNGVQTRFKCKLDVKRCKRFVFPPSSLLPRSNALKTKAIRYFQTDRTLTRIVSPPLYEWIYWPITLRVTNAVNDDYSAGFKPDIEWNEYDLTQNPTDALLPLGDPDEFMLGKAISLITGINRSARSMNTLSQPIMRGESVYQSTERHATGGMLMVPEEKNN